MFDKMKRVLRPVRMINHQGRAHMLYVSPDGVKFDHRSLPLWLVFHLGFPSLPRFS